MSLTAVLSDLFSSQVPVLRDICKSEDSFVFEHMIER